MGLSELTEKQRAEREQRFRHVDMEHPLMQLLFEWQPPQARSGEEA